MEKIRHLFPGGNTCLGFYSFYDYMTYPDIKRKIVLKGGPGVGKSTFMKKLGEEFAQKGIEIEYHWCSSDNDSLDGVVIGNQQFCVLDGTAPHIVDPRFPGAVDEIINLGDFWDRDAVKKNRSAIVGLSENISRCFNRAYIRLREVEAAYEEWKSYYEEARDEEAINRNILALTQDFLPASSPSPVKPRHLFAGAITPDGLVSKVESIIDPDFALYAVKGSPGSGIKSLFDHVLHILNLQNTYAEIFHSPFDPREIDIIVLPRHKAVLLDVSANIFNYSRSLTNNKYKRWLDFDQFSQKDIIDPYGKQIFTARNRFDAGINEAVTFINTAKKYHDELETYYVPAMDFESVGRLREKLFGELLADL
ncbi:MAG: PRK06851 family protein [Syntrophomonas sp.]